jgi:hypothetical protein
MTGKQIVSETESVPVLRRGQRDTYHSCDCDKTYIGEAVSLREHRHNFKEGLLERSIRKCKESAHIACLKNPIN